MTTYWAQKTGHAIMYAARTMINDANPMNYAVPAEAAITAFRLAIIDVMRELNLPRGVRIPVSFGVDAYSAPYPTADVDVLSIGTASWSRTGQTIERVAPEVVRARIENDLEQGIAVQHGDPTMWATEALNALTVLIYPAASVASELVFYATEHPTYTYSPTSVIALNRGATSLLELRVAMMMAEGMSPENFGTHGVSPNIANVLRMRYNEMLAREKWAASMSRRQAHVSLRRP